MQQYRMMPVPQLDGTSCSANDKLVSSLAAEADNEVARFVPGARKLKASTDRRCATRKASDKRRHENILLITSCDRQGRRRTGLSLLPTAMKGGVRFPLF